LISIIHKKQKITKKKLQMHIRKGDGIAASFLISGPLLAAGNPVSKKRQYLTATACLS